MKKISFLICGLAAVCFMFSSCKSKEKPIDDTLPNGFYVSEAGANLVADNAMDQGKNEADNQVERAGMYEKYIVLEAGKTYEFINKKGEAFDHFGSALEFGDSLIITDNHEIAGYKGSLTANTTFKVNETALCHIVLDFDEDGKLADVGGPQCIIVPVEWGISGAMNGWGYTAGVKNGNKFEWKDVTVESVGAFKFKHNDAWKINLDIANLVKANTNLGQDCEVGGADIAIERAIYNITLEFVGPKATTAESYKYSVEKIKDLPEVDPTQYVYSFIGTVNGNWDADTDLELISNSNNHLVYQAEVTLAAGEFKIRRDHDWTRSFGFGDMTIDGADVSDNGGNVMLAADYNGTATFEFDWNGSTEENVKLTFGALVPVDYVDGYFYVNCAGLITTPNIYSWSDAKGNLFGGWPGAALTEKDGDLYKIAYHAVKGAEYKAIINGEEGQTVDSDPLVLTGQDALVTVGAKGDDGKFAITFANK